MHGDKMDQESKAKAEQLISSSLEEKYDHSSRIWEELSGDHFHHGFYDTGSTASNTDIRSAQIRMIEEALRFANVSEDPVKKPKNILDVGCGIGGSSRYLANKYGTQCIGIDISPVEIKRARVLTAAQGSESQVTFEVADATDLPFPDGQFDLIWCIDCADHVPDKAKLMPELARVAAPGATIIIICWCRRDLSPSEHDLRPEEKKWLETNEMSVKWFPTCEFIKLLEAASLQDIKSADWSQHVAPFWPALRSLRLSWKGFMAFVRHGGWKLASLKALRPTTVFDSSNGVLVYSIITSRKPE
nr:O-methyltransferase 8 [Hamelia patens]